MLGLYFGRSSHEQGPAVSAVKPENTSNALLVKAVEASMATQD